MTQEIEKILHHESYESRVLLKEEEIKSRIKELGEQITRDYQGEKIVLIGTLTGSFIFLADLCREIELDCETVFLQISSYAGETQTSGTVTLKSDIKSDIEDKAVIIVEDIVDSGLSLQFLKEHVQAKKPKSLKIISLLSKPSAHKIEIAIDYLGFEIENHFVIGYGLDFAEYKRNLKNIYTVHFKTET